MFTCSEYITEDFTPLGNDVNSSSQFNVDNSADYSILLAHSSADCPATLTEMMLVVQSYRQQRENLLKGFQYTSIQDTLIPGSDAEEGTEAEDDQYNYSDLE